MLNHISSWNTWDVRCLNAVMKIPEMAELRIALYDSESKLYQDEFLWKNVERFGLHHPYGEYFDIDLRFGSMTFTMIFASEDDRFVYKIIQKDSRPNIRFYIVGMLRWGVNGTITKENGTLSIRTGDHSYDFSVLGRVDSTTIINSSHQGILLHADDTIYISCNNEMTQVEMDRYLEAKRSECENSYIKGNGTLMDTPEAIIKGIMWNTIYEPLYKRLCTPVSRAWCTGNGVGFGSYVLFEWDTFFAGLLSAIQDKGIAYQQIYSIMMEMTGDGMIPNFGAQNGSSIDRSQPPVGSYCILKLYRQFGDRELLENTFEGLLIWNSWWMKNRDGNKDGLLEWGSNPYPKDKKVLYEANNHQAAMFESGLDNSPMYDGVNFNMETHTMEYIDVGLNALYALDNWALAEIALILGKADIAEKLQLEYNRMKRQMNELLWDEECGIYLNRYWDGRFNYRLSPTNFYPMIAGVATPEQSARMIKDHLLSEKEFWGEYVIPSISREDKAFEDNDYWRGRIWGPMNFLVGEGIKRYDFYDEAFLFAKKSQNLFQKEWKKDNHIYENYNAITGDGDDVKNADPVYTWGGLLGYLAVSELIEAQPWNGMRFGCFSDKKASIFNFPVNNHRYNVVVDKGLTVERNEKIIVKSDVPIIITGFIQEDDRLSLEIISKIRGKVVLYPFEGVKSIHVTVRSNTLTYRVEKEIVIPV
ncbi:MAG TPA: trehalase family glycosidase [Ruminiclostridium sp.]